MFALSKTGFLPFLVLTPQSPIRALIQSVHARNTRHIIEGVECDSPNHTVFLFSPGPAVSEPRTKLERDFQAQLIKDLYDLFPGCILLKNDSSYQQGIPDLLILFNDRWAMLECKRDFFSPFQPNQEWFIDKLDDMSYAAVIYPENKEAIIHDLQQSLRPRRTARRTQRE